MQQVRYIQAYASNSKYNACSNPNEVYEVEYLGQKVCMMKIAESTYTIVNSEFIDKVLKYKWYKMQNGYTGHTVTKMSGEEITGTFVYLHQYILKYCAGKPCPEDLSVDHINRVKIDNRVSNLRYATQSLQNENRERTYTNRQEPFDELKAIGIDRYPKHLRYDHTQGRFVIEKHPKKKLISGTRSGGIINKYHDLIKTGVLLDNEMQTDEAPFIDAWREYFNIATEFNKLIDSEVFDTSFTDPQASFAQHLLLIDIHVGKNTGEEILMKDKTILYSDAEFTLTKKMIPQYVSYSKATLKRGGCFKYERRFPDGKRVMKALSTSSAAISTEDKYKLMLEAMKEIA